MRLIDPPSADPLDRKYRLPTRDCFRWPCRGSGCLLRISKTVKTVNSFRSSPMSASVQSPVQQLQTWSQMANSLRIRNRARRRASGLEETHGTERREARRGIQMTEDDDEFDKVIGRIHAPPGYGLAYVEMMKANYRRWAAEGDPMYIEIVKQMDGDDTEHQDDPSEHHGHCLLYT